jgi:hypothetical protein
MRNQCNEVDTETESRCILLANHKGVHYGSMARSPALRGHLVESNMETISAQETTVRQQVYAAMREARS